ncbi:MAG: DNA topoisomerase 4 subunit A [Actinobacteria bacterium]|uniref:DNA topoisomerase (ATP-hydrolyzing) n=1 Tax=freshwater metagenome TaxID=449393 RepID=A0A6J6NU91_9ZZZZ|nr:DNA topoisomerase 4 subunit A [Actinomycetota bacterium]
MTSKEQPAEKILDIDLTREMQDSFLEYSYSVIYARALPDARDGLKPVHRRIIYQMGEMGLRPDRGHVKSARVTGEVMGKLHPHGDGAIYDALVRMAQAFTLRVPLIDGHGNFGSLDDGPAAARYTEVRLSTASLLMNDGLDEDVIDFKPNYDAQLTEPEVLPAAFPNLLVNGSSGIAVGMATNMPPHNLREVVAAAIHLLKNPAATTKQLMKYVPGPDLPNGGIIMGLDGVKDAYESGKGSFKTRARVSVESVSARKLGLVVTELPYLVGPEKVIEKIKEGVNTKKLLGISDVIDLTDRTNGLKLVIELKTGFDPQVVLDLLYRFTPMEDSFGINNVALVDGRPATLGLKDLLQVYLTHRLSVIRRRTTNRLGKREARLHLIDGLLIAVLNIDEVIQVIRTSDEVDEARAKLRKVFELSELQAEYILELRLRRLTKFSQIELETEKSQLQTEIVELKRILASKEALDEVVISELQAVADKHGDARRTTLISEFEEVKPMSVAKVAGMDAQLADSPSSVRVTTSGLISRIDSDDVALVIGTKRKRHDAVMVRVKTTTRSDIGFVTNLGRVVRIHVADIPAISDPTDVAGGAKASEFLGLARKERLLHALELGETTGLSVGTKLGTVKRLSADWPAKNEFEIISLKPGDELVGACEANDQMQFVFVTNDAQLLRFKADSVRPQGRGAAGVAGINLAKGSEAVYFGAVDDTAVVITAANNSSAIAGTDSGSAKLSELSEFPMKGRATGGVRAHKFIRNEDQVYFAWAGNPEFLASAADGKPIEFDLEPSKRDASGSKIASPLGAIGTA